MSQQRATKTTHKPKPQTEETVEAKAADTSDTEDLLDQIDAVLEINAADFVKGYVQKGGQ